MRPARLELDGVPGRAAARRELGVSTEEHVVVVAGRLIPEKRTEVALAAASLLRGVRVVVLGDGPERERLRSAYPRAQFLGLVPRTQALVWMRAADAVVSASREEGAPSVVREARALGTRVVALACGDLASAATLDPGLFVVPSSSEERA